MLITYLHFTWIVRNDTNHVADLTSDLSVMKSMAITSGAVVAAVL
jgi:hypothetical protein